MSDDDKVRYRDYISNRWFPTFNSHPIELNIHRIPGLRERFINQNDDMYYIKPMKPLVFFKMGNR